MTDSTCASKGEKRSDFRGGGFSPAELYIEVGISRLDRGSNPVDIKVVNLDYRVGNEVTNSCEGVIIVIKDGFRFT